MTAFINSIACHLPANKLSNGDIARLYPEWSVEKISVKTGIECRHIVSEKETAVDLAYLAAEKLFDDNEINRRTIDFVVLCTQSPDYFLPTSACILQNRLNLPKECGAFDFNLGCSGYVYGLGIAKGLIQTGQACNVLFLTGETYSKYIHEKDKGNKTLFGDAGTATLISNRKTEKGINAAIGDFHYGTDGSQAETLIVKNGGLRHGKTDGIDNIDETGEFVSNDNNLFMDGKAIFNFTAFQIPPLVQKTIEKNGLSFSDIDEFIFHQANEFMLNTVRKRCNISEDKFYVDMKNTGNTVSNTIPIALLGAYSKGMLANKRHILLAGFGVGLSMGAVVIKIQNETA